jgi:hypothetical protein
MIIDWDFSIETAIKLHIKRTVLDLINYVRNTIREWIIHEVDPGGLSKHPLSTGRTRHDKSRVLIDLFVFITMHVRRRLENLNCCIPVEICFRIDHLKLINTLCLYEATKWSDPREGTKKKILAPGHSSGSMIKSNGKGDISIWATYSQVEYIVTLCMYLNFVFVYLLFYVPLKNCSLIWRRHHYHWKAAEFRPTLGVQGHWAGGIFIVPLLLWHGTSVFPVSSEGPPHSVDSYDTWGCGGPVLTRILKGTFCYFLNKIMKEKIFCLNHVFRFMMRLGKCVKHIPAVPECPDTVSWYLLLSSLTRNVE